MIVHCGCATFSKSLNTWNIDKSVSDIRIRIQFPFESSFWISLSGCKLTILLDIQPANRIVIISVRLLPKWKAQRWESNRKPFTQQTDVFASRDDRVVDFNYPILSCFWKTISVFYANPVLVKIILTVSENYPKVYYDGQHSLHFCVVSILPHEVK